MNLCHSGSCLLIALISASFGLTSGTTVWTIHILSHPYKSQLYTAELVVEPYVYYWCADHIRREDAVVLCNDVNEDHPGARFNVTTGRVEFGALKYDPAVNEAFMNETFACVGNEAKLSDCPMRAVGADRCPSGKLGQVDCFPADNSRKNLTATLTGPRSDAGKGVIRVESRALRRVEGLVCVENGSWGHSEARVACKMLGYDGNLAWPTDPSVVADVTSLEQSYVIKGVSCDGTEASLNDCRHTDMCQATDFLSKSFICPGTCEGEAAAVICV